MTKQEKTFIKQFAGKYRMHYALYFLLVVLMSVFSICSVLSLNNFLQILFSIDNASSSTSELNKMLENVYGYFLKFGKQKALFYFTAIIIVVYLLKDVFTYLSQYQIGRIRNKILFNVRNAMMEKCVGQDISFVNRYKKGDLLSRFSSDVTETEETLLKPCQTIINSAVIVLLYLVMLFYIDYLLTLCALILFPVVAFFTSLLSRKLRGQSKKLQSDNARLISVTEETVAGLRIIKSLAAIEYMNRRFRDFNQSFTALRNKVYRRVDLSSPQSEFFSSIVISIILLIGGTEIMQTHSLSPSMFVVYLVLFILIIKPAKDASTAYYNIKRSAGALSRICDIIYSDRDIQEPLCPKAMPVLTKGITFKDVNFSYGDNQVLKKVNLCFEKGKTTAVVGASGSGKTTMADLIMKFYQLKDENSDILFDDVSVNDINGEEIRRHIAVVTQETVLFNDSVQGNIAFGGDYTFEQIKHAADIANATEFIEMMPEKFNTNIGDKGSKLSGGQRQRLSIARAVLKDASVLILDEATSALDTDSERKVQQALDTVSKDRTTIVIAHRLSTVVNADKIVVLDRGEIKEQGTHGELYALHGIYYNLYRMQQIG
ncbi:MAG: ABC transporter ATP-binding protein [Bacteroidales bacterium]|nr:ABC transporter ATP-binding protein [Bacteroidales bacterium]